MHPRISIRRSVRPSVRYAFSKNPRKRLFSIADDIRMNGGTSRDPFYTRTHTNTHARKCMRNHPRARTKSIIPMTTDCKTQNYARTHARTYARTHTHTLMHSYARIHTQRAAEIAEKLPSDSDDAQQQKGHNFTVLHIHIHKTSAKINWIAVPR